MEITLGHTYRWHATTENTECKVTLYDILIAESMICLYDFISVCDRLSV